LQPVALPAGERAVEPGLQGRPLLVGQLYHVSLLHTSPPVRLTIRKTTTNNFSGETLIGLQTRVGRLRLLQPDRHRLADVGGGPDVERLRLPGEAGDPGAGLAAGRGDVKTKGPGRRRRPGAAASLVFTRPGRRSQAAASARGF